MCGELRSIVVADSSMSSSRQQHRGHQQSSTACSAHGSLVQPSSCIPWLLSRTLIAFCSMSLVLLCLAVLVLAGFVDHHVLPASLVPCCKQPAKHFACEQHLLSARHTCCGFIQASQSVVLAHNVLLDEGLAVCATAYWLQPLDVHRYAACPLEQGPLGQRIGFRSLLCIQRPLSVPA